MSLLKGNGDLVMKKDVVVEIKKERKNVFTKKELKDYNKCKVKPLISKLLIKFTDISRLIVVTDVFTKERDCI